jgi:hypothetical protein
MGIYLCVKYIMSVQTRHRRSSSRRHHRVSRRRTTRGKHRAGARRRTRRRQFGGLTPEEIEAAKKNRELIKERNRGEGNILTGNFNDSAPNAEANLLSGKLQG